MESVCVLRLGLRCSVNEEHLINEPVKVIFLGTFLEGGIGFP